MKNDFKYGSAEYSICAAQEKLDEALAVVKKLRVETCSIQELNPIIWGSSFLGKARIEKGPHNSIENYVEWGSYSWFRKDNEDHIERCVTAATKWHTSALEEVEKWHQENLPIIENNKNAAENIKNFMSVVGIPASYNVYEQVGRKRDKSWVPHSAGFLSDISRVCKTDDGYESKKRELADFLIKVSAWKKKHLDEIANTKREKEKSDEHLRKIAKAMELAEKWGLKYADNDDLLSKVTEISKNKWIEETFEEGEELDHSCCDGCSSWVYGERRCSCGNRRMSLTVEGDFFKGFSHYVEAY